MNRGMAQESTRVFLFICKRNEEARILFSILVYSLIMPLVSHPQLHQTRTKPSSAYLQQHFSSVFCIVFQKWLHLSSPASSAAEGPMCLIHFLWTFGILSMASSPLLLPMRHPQQEKPQLSLLQESIGKRPQKRTFSKQIFQG